MNHDKQKQKDTRSNIMQLLTDEIPTDATVYWKIESLSDWRTRGQPPSKIWSYWVSWTLFRVVTTSQRGKT